MFKFQAKSLATKLIAVTGGTIALVLLASNAVLISHTQDRVSELVYTQADTEAKAIASDIAAEIGALAGATRAMGGVIEQGQATGFMDRKSVVNMLKANTEKNSFALGSWFAEEPNAFDGKSRETPEQLEFLRARRCDHIQGFLFSKPMPADELTHLLAQGSIPVTPDSSR